MSKKGTWQEQKWSDEDFKRFADFISGKDKTRMKEEKLYRLAERFFIAEDETAKNLKAVKMSIGNLIEGNFNDLEKEVAKNGFNHDAILYWCFLVFGDIKDKDLKTWKEWADNRKVKDMFKSMREMKGNGEFR